MAYEVIARKYRPQTFEDLVGQQHISETLQRAIAQKRVAHAYLFVGPRGTGKTTSARIFAKALNCDKGPTGTPCNACTTCRAITQGNCLDVMEIDGASNNKVDEVRELRENARFAPSVCLNKIFIIDEVHMLSISAFNALLKILEEPPAHVKFLFATTEPQKVPATILSRCQRFDFRRISVRDIVDRLRLICDAEGIEAEEAALVGIARGAQGGMRDAQSALDQLIAFRGKNLTEADVLSVFGLVSQKHLEELAAAVLDGDIPGVIDAIASFDASGKDLERVLIDLLEHMRNVLVYAYSGSGAAISELTEGQIETIKAQSATVHPARVALILEGLIETEGRLKHSLSKRTLLETALIRAAQDAQHATLDEVLAEIERLKKGVSLPEPEKKN